MMELRDWAHRILSADTLEEKLLDPGKLTDSQPGSAYFYKEPTRPIGMQFQKHSRKDKLPSIQNFGIADNRAVCLHRFAGHELLAVEIMAYALLAFPDAPKHFRRGIAATLKEEQEHVRLYMECMEGHGIKFGDLPLFKHFWAFTPFLTTPEDYVSVMSLTFEMANLDFAPLYGAAFKEHGDIASANLMEKILKDEIAHVAFGWNWLQKLKPKNQTQWEAWSNALPDNLSPKRAKGVIFMEKNRLKAGISPDWILNYKESIGRNSSHLNNVK